MSKMADLAGQQEQEMLDARDLEELHCIQREDQGDRIRQDKQEEEIPFEKIFWDDDAPKNLSLQGGMFYCSMEMGKFVKNHEEKGFKIWGIRFDESNNCEFIFTAPEEP